MLLHNNTNRHDFWKRGYQSLIYIYISTCHIQKILTIKQWDGTLISQENSPNLQDQDFITIVIAKEPSLIFFLSKTKTFVIMDVSKHQLSFLFWFHSWWIYFGPTIKILSKPILDGFELFKKSFVAPKDLLAFSPLLIFLVNLLSLGQSNGTI